MKPTCGGWEKGRTSRYGLVYRTHDETGANPVNMKRNFQFLSIAAFSVVAIAGWIYVPRSAAMDIKVWVVLHAEDRD